VAIADNIHGIRERMERAALRAKRNPPEIALMAVTKTQSAERIREAYDAGIRLFGENRVQEFSNKASALTDLKDAERHMIGHLQSNKAGKAVELFSAVDSVDSLRLAQRLNQSAHDLGKKIQVLIEINVGGEEAKSGAMPDSRELEDLLHAAHTLEHLDFRGFMTVPPFTDDPQLARPYFHKLREIRDQIAAQGLPAVGTGTLSMGMSHDFEVAIEEGSTCVRVGTAIFGARKKP